MWTAQNVCGSKLFFLNNFNFEFWAEYIFQTDIFYSFEMKIKYIVQDENIV
jgi:hypothetical protein